MVSPILFCGGEDLSFSPIGGQIGAAQANNTVWVDATATHFRSGYARYALNVQTNNLSDNQRLLTPQIGNQTAFWFSARIWCKNGGNPNSQVNYPLRFYDSSGVLRIRIKNVSTNLSGLQGPFTIEKLNAAGSATLLGTFVANSGFSPAPAIPDKFDLQMNYGTSGSINVYINNSLVCATGTVDTTTDGNAALSQAAISSVSSNSGGVTEFDSSWSEVIIATRDTRAMSLVTQTATAFGNAHTFTNGAVANVNTNLANQATPDYSQSANQIEEYQVTPAIPAGSFSVVSVVQQGQCIVGSTGPQNIQFMVRTASTDYTSATISPGPGAAWGLLTNNWDLNPATSAAWATTDLANASVNFNMGYKSIT